MVFGSGELKTINSSVVVMGTKLKLCRNVHNISPFKDTGLVKVSILEHFMFFACLYMSCTVIFNVKTASFCHYSLLHKFIKQSILTEFSKIV